MDRKIIALLFVIVLAGCQAGTGSVFGSLNNEETIQTNQGTEGIEISFQTNYPPEIVFDEQETDIVLNILNKGVHSINENDDQTEEIYLNLITDRNIEIIPNSNDDTNVIIFTETLFGKDGANSVGDEEQIEFLGLVDKTTKLRNKTTLTGVICYPYVTKLQVSTCFDASLITGKEGICSATTTQYKSQGAPIAIKEIQEKKLQRSGETNTYLLKIYIENVGEGIPIQSNQIRNHCLGEVVEDSEERYIGIESVSSKVEIKGLEVDCDEGIVKTDGDNKKYIECRATLDSQEDIGSTNKILNIELNYGYQKSTTKILTIE